MFTSKMIPKLSNLKDIKVSKTLLDLWTSFATDGYKRQLTIYNNNISELLFTSGHKRVHLYAQKQCAGLG